MKLVFNMAFDGEPWPGPLGYGDTGRDAVVDEDWVGPHGLLRHMETQLGLGGLLPSQDERDTALIEAVRATRGFWSPSAEVDPFATTRTLRRWRDHLVLFGGFLLGIAPRSCDRGGKPPTQISTADGATSAKAADGAKAAKGKKESGRVTEKSQPRKQDRRYGKFAVEFLKTYAVTNNKHSEVMSKESILRVHLVPAFGDLGLSEIRPERIEKYKAEKL